MGIVTQQSLKNITRDLRTVKAAADTFVKWTNENIEEKEEGTRKDIEVEAALPQKRTKKKKQGQRDGSS